LIEKEFPDVSQWLVQAKQEASASRCGMFLIHNGVVRESARAQVRDGVQDASKVNGMFFDYDELLVQKAIDAALEKPGIECVKVWLAKGELAVGDDIMCVLVGGDIRPRVIDCLQDLVGTIKQNCVKEVEHYEN
jgi:molybdopterin synthase catalytic subunit